MWNVCVGWVRVCVSCGIVWNGVLVLCVFVYSVCVGCVFGFCVYLY